jgi:hypothetical protein
MDFRFTLSHTPKQSVSSDIDLPDNSEGENVAGANTDWITGSNPSVSLPGTGPTTTVRSDVWAVGYTFSTGLEYTINYSIDYNTHANTSGNNLQFVVLDGADNILYSENKSVGTGAGSVNSSSTFTAPAGAVKYGFWVSVFNILSNSGSSFDINNTITGTVATQAEPGVPTSQEISQPDGWEDCKLILERHDDFNSLIEHYDGGAGGAFIFYGNNGQENGGIDYLKHLEQVYGFNVQVNILTEFSFDSSNYEEIFSGQVDISAKNEMPDNLLQAPIIRDDVWTKFITRRDTQVDLSSNVDLDGNLVPPAVPVTINLTAQKILKIHYSFEELNTSAVMDVSDNEYIQFTPGKFELDEMEDFYNLVPINNPALPGPTFDVREAGDYTFDIRWTVSLILGTTENHANSLDVFIQINEEAPTTFSRSNQTSVGVDYTFFTYSGTVSLNEGDSVRIYAQQDSVSVLNWGFWGVDGLNNIALGGSYDQSRPNGMPDIPTYTRVTAHTLYPETTAQGYLIHDLLDAIIRRICGVSLYSEFLGSQNTNSRQYPSNGCGWMYAILKGLQIRQYTITEKPFFASFNQVWNGIHPILCLGLDYEELDDSPAARVIRIEQMDHFYSDDVSINISNVRDIQSSYDKESIFKTVKPGYKKWQADDISGIDDPQTKRTYALPFDKVGKELNLESDFIAAGLTIETTRRTTRKKSADYKYDNDIFIIAINEDDVSPDRYVPELDENFDQISGLTDSDTRYNSILTPMRNLLRWAKFIGGCMQPYSTGYYRFVAGEGNYDMLSDYSCGSGNQCQAIICDPLSERQDISLQSYNSVFGYLHLAQECEMTVPMSKNQYDVIKNNRKKSIGISQTDANFTKFKIKKLVYNLIEGTATINAWPKTFFNIQVINAPIEMPNCEVQCNPYPYDGDYLTILSIGDSLGFTLPSCDQRIKQNQLVLDLKAAGIWDELDLLYVFATDGDENYACINWKDPGNFTCLRVNSPAHIENIGVQGNGTTSYLNTQWVAGINAVNFQLNDGGAFCYVNNEVAAANRFQFGADNASSDQTSFSAKNTGSVHRYGINSSNVTVGSSVSSIGFFHIRRTASNDLRLFKDGSQVGATSTQVSTNLTPSQPMAICAFNANGGIGGHSTAQIGVFGIGASLSGMEPTLNTIWNDYFTSL